MSGCRDPKRRFVGISNDSATAGGQQGDMVIIKNTAGSFEVGEQ